MPAASAVLTRDREGKLLVASSLEECRKRILAGLGPTAVPTSEATGGADALIKLESDDFRTVLLDSQLEDLDAEELAEIIRARFPQVNVVVLERGKDAEQLSFDLRESCAADTGRESPAEAGADAIEGAAATVDALPKMIGTSQKMQQIYRLARLVAPRDTAALIVGATGTGKELVARGIHDLSRRSQGPFIVVNCAAIPESLLEAELFGFTRGAFTGAFQSRLGRIHAAHGGTLLLDEVGELPLSMQAKLLRFVQEGEVQRLGSADLFRVDARLIAATNADLLQRVREKQFREDLYYRLAVFPIALPRLQDRWEDILPLGRHFLAELCVAAGVPRKSFSAEAAHTLQKYSWPGNVRELQHWVERAFVLSEANEEIGTADLSMFAEAV
ncbi:MAG: sigma-54 dependent transcriptional regulator [Acidobacteriia bacterium]|nr:sigma-54 dependent transcriptional regulator [Terriglobia bacterium]